MPNVLTAYQLARIVDTTPHQQVTSTATGDAQDITPPKGANAALVQAATTDGFLTFDGSTPSSTNGMRVKIDQNMFLLPLGEVGSGWKWASSAGTNAILNLTWLM